MIMSPSSFPQMAAAIFATALMAMTPPTVSSTPEAESGTPQEISAARPALLQPVAARQRSRLDADTPGCAEAGLVGTLPRARDVSTNPPSRGAPMEEEPQALSRGMQTAMHQCVVRRFDPSDPIGLRQTVYRL